MKTYDTEVQTLVSNLSLGEMDSVAYDTAWVARLTRLESDLGKSALEWLCANQNLDGSWGNASFAFPHDKIINTLAAVVAIASLGRRSSDQTRIQRGILALERLATPETARILANHDRATVAFEMLVPTLLQEAQEMGLVLRNTELILGGLAPLRQMKLQKIERVKISKQNTLAFSAEMAGQDKASLLDTANLVARDGSVSNSPAASAYFLNFVNPDEPRVWQYLQTTQKNDGGFPAFLPFDIFEKIWILWTLLLYPGWQETTHQQLRAHYDWLYQHWLQKNGASQSSSFLVNDADDTAIAYLLLKQAGYPVELSPMLKFEGQDCFTCYPLESVTSHSTNVHALMALRAAGYEVEHATVQKVLRYLRRFSSSGLHDKWHASVYYTTSHLLLAVLEYDLELAESAARWLINAQRPDGSWGEFIPSAEETAYSLIALTKWHQKNGKGDIAALRRGRSWLEAHSEPPYQALWIAKTLYHPTNVIRAVVLAALALTSSV